MWTSIHDNNFGNIRLSNAKHNPNAAIYSPEDLSRGVTSSACCQLSYCGIWDHSYYLYLNILYRSNRKLYQELPKLLDP